MSELLNPSEGDDYEWVNAWATKSNSAPKADLKAAPAPKPEPAPDAVAASAAPSPAAPAPADVSPPRKPTFDPDMFVHPATRRFFATFRAPPAAEPVAPAAPQADEPVAAAPPPAAADTQAPVPEAPAELAPIVVQHEPAAVESSQVSLVPEADQLERDIAEIQRVRDALLAQPPFTIIDPRRVHGRFARLRNSDAVPIVIGTVVGLSLLIVFGAAASLITLR